MKVLNVDRNTEDATRNEEEVLIISDVMLSVPFFHTVSYSRPGAK